MNWQIILGGLVVGVIGFFIGRYVLFVENGLGIVRKTKVTPLRNIYAKNFKANQIYKMMASKLLKDRFVNVTTKNVQRTIEKLAKVTLTKKERFSSEQIEGDVWKIYLK